MEETNFSMWEIMGKTYGSLFDGGEDTGGLNDVFGTSFAPWDGLGVAFAEDGDGFAVDNQIATISLDFALEFAVGRVILEHVNHVVKADERVIDGNDSRSTFDRRSQNETSDTSESVDSNFAHDCLEDCRKW